ncbi:MFS transporter [Nocardia sp.]|uniref:MFS transporter n=1 Tax=Nocardia sp. TaxID=1821 RepID=UPI0026126527|nr:MFS transporter [Nocardia sp.]
MLFGAALVIELGFGLVTPVLPQFARSFGVDIASTSAIVSAYALMRLLFAPVSGRLVQQLGERSVYVSGLLIIACSAGASAFARNYWQLLALQSVGGIGSTMFTVSSMALLIRMSPTHERGRVSALWSTYFLIGSMSGPIVGGVLAGFGLRVPFVAFATALVVVGIAVHFGLRNSQIVSPIPASEGAARTFRQVLSLPGYRALLWSNFTSGVALFGVRMALVPLLVTEALGQSARMAGVTLTVFAVGTAAALSGSGRFSDKFGRRPLLIAGTLISGLGTAASAMVPTVPWLLAMSFLAGSGCGMFTPAQQAALADLMGPKVHGGSMLAGFQMSGDLGVVLGPIAIGAVAQHLSFGFGLWLAGALLATASTVWAIVPEPSSRSPLGRTRYGADDMRWPAGNESLCSENRCAPRRNRLWSGRHRRCRKRCRTST